MNWYHSGLPYSANLTLASDTKLAEGSNEIIAVSLPVVCTLLYRFGFDGIHVLLVIFSDKNGMVARYIIMSISSHAESHQ